MKQFSILFNYKIENNLNYFKIVKGSYHQFLINRQSITLHKVLLMFCIVINFNFSFFAQGNWTWMSGSTLLNQPPQYGTAYNATNTPGQRYGSVTWTDQTGKMWLFSGNDGAAYYNDLWVYDPLLLQWKWVSGPNIPSQPGVYGTQGLASSSNNPGGRIRAATWTDNNGNLWLFGGYGLNNTTSIGSLNDLWKYNIASNQWTWMHGTNVFSMLGTYGTQGTPAPANMPSSRHAPAVFTHTNGTFWLYGGNGKGANNSTGPLMDLWKYDPTNNQWAWMKGGQNTSSVSVYGTMGVAAPGNLPSSRSSSTYWVDLNNRFWFYGGVPFSGIALYSSELWSYDPSTNNWTWFGGTSTTNTTGVYGTMNTPSATVKPGPRTNAKGWTDASGNLWLFGGEGFGSSGTTWQPLSDTWRYIPSLGQWSWEKGPSTQFGAPVYGTQLVTNYSNTPGSWIDCGTWNSNSTLWLYGGQCANLSTSPATFTRVSDMFKFESCSPVPNPTVVPNLNQGMLCGGASTLLLFPANPGNVINWYSGVTSTTSIFTGTAYNTVAPVVTQPSIISVYAEAITASCVVTQSIRVNYSYTVNPGVTLTTVSNNSLCSGSSLTLTASGASQINWQPNSISGNSCVVNPVLTTTYYVTGTNSYNCKDIDTLVVSVLPSPNLQYSVMPQHICEGEIATVLVTGADYYTWPGGLSGASQSFVAMPNLNYSVTGLFSTSGCKNTVNINLVLSDCTGLITNNNSTINVYPNPFNGLLNISAPIGTSIEIADITGNVFVRQSLELEKLSIDISDSQSGVYILTIFKNGHASSHYKLFKI